jgi:hypothetical protein
MSGDEIKVLRDKNGGGRRWKLALENHIDENGNVSSAWVTNDRSLYAVYTQKSATFSKPFLVIITAEQHKADKQTSREEAERNLNGFTTVPSTVVCWPTCWAASVSEITVAVWASIGAENQPVRRKMKNE